jgi:hypothetical protein
MNEERKEILLFVGSMTGEAIIDEESINWMNSRQNEKAREFSKKHPGAVIGNINIHIKEQRHFRPLNAKVPMFNYECDFAIPSIDRKLKEMLKAWNSKLQDSSKASKMVSNIQDRIESMGGIQFHWI